MDSPKPRSTQRSLCYFCFALLLSLFVSFFFSFVSGLIAVAIGSLPVPPPAAVPALCRVVSSSVDLRSSKVCELGFLNYKAKNVFYPFERTRFRCRYDYYWASVFKVEYKEDSSDQTLHALAEAPKEALPLDCRPSFNVAWLTKDKFKVNETYNCRYMPDVSKVDIYPDSLFNCQAKEPSMLEMLRRFYVLFTMSIKALFSKSGNAKAASQGAVAGIAFGVLGPLIFIILAKLLQELKVRLADKWNAGRVRLAAYEARFRRTCLFVAYISATGWFVIQYAKLLGLSDLFVISYVGEKPVE
ncbi:hypothetical protein MRB53_003617 [Persea americana]|uniref:Uncharacterized protein n=1 Tax=Persea americana TaxID=3435 RepID=A0ACC2MZI5_PERAE|nr:hypothetical protein MRB53_003617 [Persea americana]|eukprot:TRINITY_DN17764_c1_g2_i4.p1 TRINITY_DN17764_c1_g2~~TRINITY_DN17764_c1_g2_i4.p1  ORF type:complete len:300 (-),score=41.41 TRINITY_DN17764_c1_g2_i4:443-1342(-)